MLYVLKCFVLLKMKRKFLQQEEKNCEKFHIVLFQVFIFVLRQVIHKSVPNLENRTQEKLVDIS